MANLKEYLERVYNESNPDLPEKKVKKMAKEGTSILDHTKELEKILHKWAGIDPKDIIKKSDKTEKKISSIENYLFYKYGKNKTKLNQLNKIQKKHGKKEYSAEDIKKLKEKYDA